MILSLGRRKKKLCMCGQNTTHVSFFFRKHTVLTQGWSVSAPGISLFISLSLNCLLFILNLSTFCPPLIKYVWTTAFSNFAHTHLNCVSTDVYSQLCVICAFRVKKVRRWSLGRRPILICIKWWTASDSCSKKHALFCSVRSYMSEEMQVLEKPSRELKVSEHSL